MSADAAVAQRVRDAVYELQTALEHAHMHGIDVKLAIAAKPLPLQGVSRVEVSVETIIKPILQRL